MTLSTMRLVLTMLTSLTPAFAGAQHTGHQATPTVPSPQLAPCAQVQAAVETILTAATMRLEAARQSNDPVQLRAAVDYAQQALRDLRTQLAPCATAVPATPPATTDPHAGHTMPAAPTPKAAAPKSPPAAPKTAKAKTDPHAGHQMAKPAEKATEQQMDPVTGLLVDPAAAPKTTYQGQTYYFSSEASKKEFLENPAKFARKPKK